MEKYKVYYFFFFKSDQPHSLLWDNYHFAGKTTQAINHFLALFSS